MQASDLAVSKPYTNYETYLPLMEFAVRGIFVIKVEICVDPKRRGIRLDLNTFFRMAYPLKYAPVLKELNESLEDGQTILFHQSESIDKFLERFTTPREVVDFMIENKDDEEMRCITIGDVIYVSINEVIYMFFEE